MIIEPLQLCRRDTPIEHLARTSERLGLQVDVKRDDLTGLGLSGNKVRKLEYLMAAALAAGQDRVVTCGGIQSNHCRATAVAARRLGLQPVLLLRGEPQGPPEGNWLLDVLLGAEIHWVTPEQYRYERDARMEDLGGYVIPEGGSNALGAQGFVAAADEVRDHPADTVVCAVGSGGTLAGLAMADLPMRVLGVCVCDDRAYFVDRVQSICAEAGVDPGPPGERWDVIEGFQGRGYALSRPAELAELARVAREQGILLDPVYTGKAWFAVSQLTRQLGSRVLFWHTGGVFGLFGRGQEITEALS